MGHCPNQLQPWSVQYVVSSSSNLGMCMGIPGCMEMKSQTVWRIEGRWAVYLLMRCRGFGHQTGLWGHTSV